TARRWRCAASWASRCSAAPRSGSAAEARCIARSAARRVRAVLFPAGGGDGLQSPAHGCAAARPSIATGKPMSIKSDRWIRRMSDRPQGMIEPYEAGQVKQVDGHRIVSYGTSSYGYDVRCSREFKGLTDINSTVVDPKNFDPKCFVDVTGDECIIPPNSFALARTVEYFRIPRDVLVICLGKSTYARCGIIVNVTPLEPEWEGHVTLEFSNTTPLP